MKNTDSLVAGIGATLWPFPYITTQTTVFLAIYMIANSNDKFKM